MPISMQRDLASLGSDGGLGVCGYEEGGKEKNIDFCHCSIVVLNQKGFSLGVVYARWFCILAAQYDDLVF